jgi:hypothetical protein
LFPAKQIHVKFLLISTWRKFVVYMEGTLYPSISLLKTWEGYYYAYSSRMRVKLCLLLVGVRTLTLSIEE